MLVSDSAAPLDGLERHQAVVHAAYADHLCGQVVAVSRSPPGPVETSEKNSSSATMPPSAIWIRLSISVRERVNTSSRSP